MSKRYEILTNMTFKPDDRPSVHATSTTWSKMNKKEVKELIEFWKSQGYEYMINKRQLVVMKNVAC